MSDNGQRVLVTGAGVISPVGNSTEACWASLIAGTSGAGPITRFDAAAYETRFACEVKDFAPETVMDRKDAKRMDRFAQFAVAAAGEALKNAGLDLEKEDRDRIGVVVGSGIGGMETFESQHSILRERGPGRVSPFFIPMMISDMGAGQISIQYGLRGPNFATVSACASGAHAIGEALRLLRAGDADVMVAGGSEATITPMALAGFSSSRALSTRNDDPQRASRPFDLKRDGFVIGEGAGVIILETEEHARRRGAPLLCELGGYGSSADAYHLTAPIEVFAVKRVLGDQAKRVMMSSTKSMTGHLLGAAGGLEAVVVALAIRHGVVPPTINLDHQDSQCDLDFVPNHARETPVRIALSNSFGFGGHNVTLSMRAAT